MMKMKLNLNIFICLCLLFFGSISYGAKTKKVTTVALKSKMRDIATLVRDVLPLLATENEEQIKKNYSVIDPLLNELAVNFKKINHDQTLNAAGLAINASAMKDLLLESSQDFHDKKFQLSKAKFNSSLNLCMSCHMQNHMNPNKPITYAKEELDKIKLNDLEKAELSFVTRQYETAINYYQKYLADSKAEEDDENVLKALERELNYFLKVKNDRSLAKTFFQDNISKFKFSSLVKKEVNEWILALSNPSISDDLKSKLKGNDLNKNDEVLKEFLGKFNSDDEEGPTFSLASSTKVPDIEFFSSLVDYFNTYPNSAMAPNILWWLGKLDKRINDDYFFSLSSLYFEQCIEKFPTSVTAKDCFELYSDEMEDRYSIKLSGSKSLPKEIANKLDIYRRLIKISPK